MATNNTSAVQKDVDRGKRYVVKYFTTSPNQV